MENAIAEIADAKLAEYRQTLQTATQAIDANFSRLTQTIEVLQVDLKALDSEVNHLSDGSGILDLKVQEIHKELQSLKASLNGHSQEKDTPEQLPVTPGEEEAIAPTPDESLDESPKSLNQRALGNLLNINPGTIQRKRQDLSEEAFAEWSRNKDPHGTAWKYDPNSKKYFPLAK